MTLPVLILRRFLLIAFKFSLFGYLSDNFLILLRRDSADLRMSSGRIGSSGGVIIGSAESLLWSVISCVVVCSGEVCVLERPVLDLSGAESIACSSGDIFFCFKFYFLSIIPYSCHYCKAETGDFFII